MKVECAPRTQGADDSQDEESAPVGLDMRYVTLPWYGRHRWHASVQSGTGDTLVRFDNAACVAGAARMEKA
jgi:hypothetical protein